MNKLNGYWRFSYSDEQKGEIIEEADDYVTETFVKTEEGLKEFTECVHVSHTKKGDYEPHEKRYEDSVEIGIIENPKTKQERRWDL